MRNIPNAANTPGAPGGEYEHLMGQAGRLSAGDSAEDLKKLQDALKQLKGNQLDQMQKLLNEQIKHLSEQAGKLGALDAGSDQILPALLEYQKQLSREARENGRFSGQGNELSIAEKASELSGADKKIQDAKDAAGGKGKGLDVRTGDIESLVHWVMMAASEGAHEELKSMLDEVEKLNKQKTRARRAAAIAAGAGLLLLVGFIFGPRLVPPVDPDSDPPEQNANLPAVQQPVSNAAVPIGAAPGCKIVLTSPASAVDLPISGPVNVEWASDPPGISYALEVQPPEGEPWLIPTDGTSKNIFMENFPAGGTYEFTVSTLDAYGAVLCSEVVSFQKPAAGEAAAKKEAGEGAYCDPNGIFGC